MSRYDWESGTIKLSVKEWAKFKKAFREGWNRIQEAEMAAATRHWDEFKTGKLPKWWSQNNKAKNDLATRFENEKARFPRIWLDQVQRGEWLFNEARKRPRKPIRSDFPLAKSMHKDFPFGEARITFIDNPQTRRTLLYSSGDNNRAVEEARNSDVGKLFFCLLENVNWTRGTGGQLIGNDEYNRDAEGEGGGGNYVTLRCGPNEPEMMSGRNRMRGTI